MTPHEFIAKWTAVTLTEKSACQTHFLDLCRLLGQDDPVAADPKGTWYTFKRHVGKAAGGKGFADVWRRGCFGWEYKCKHKDLKAAYQQLQQHREALENPPLLIVWDWSAIDPTTSGRCSSGVSTRTGRARPGLLHSPGEIG